MGNVRVVLTDFERTLLRLFEDCSIVREFSSEVWCLCTRRGVPRRALKAAADSPYLLWTRAHRWMTRHGEPLQAERMYHAVSRIALKYEMDAASSARFFDDVRPTLERLRFVEIPVFIVSNNARAAVQRAIENNDMEHFIAFVVGREFRHDMVGNLKPKPNLVLEALHRSGHDSGTALLVGDSVDDMRAGRAAKLRFRVGLLQHSTASERQSRKAGARAILNRFGDLQDHPGLQRLLSGTDVYGVR